MGIHGNPNAEFRKLMFPERLWYFRKIRKDCDRRAARPRFLVCRERHGDGGNCRSRYRRHSKLVGGKNRGEKYQNLAGLAVAAGIMLVIIAASALLPALRVLRIEPARALNSD